MAGAGTTTGSISGAGSDVAVGVEELGSSGSDCTWAPLGSGSCVVLPVTFVEVSAPPELSTFISGTGVFVDDWGCDASGEPVGAVDAPEGVVDEESAEVDGEVEEAEPSGEDGADESDDGPELESDGGAAVAVPGVFATATPTPSATANEPIRPMYLAFPMTDPSPWAIAT